MAEKLSSTSAGRRQLVSKSKDRSYNVTFTDHTGKPALMSWRSESSLPDLPSWVFYMVHPDVPHDFDGCAFQRGLEEDRTFRAAGNFRYEFFFLPGAAAEECVAHYRGEMEARGTIWQQIHKVKAALGQQDGKELAGEPSPGDAPKSSLPGLVWAKRERDCADVKYRGWIFRYTDSNIEWSPDYEDRELDLVTFDPIPLELAEDEVPKFNPMDHPVNSNRMRARGREEHEEGATSWMENRKRSNWEQEATSATDDAKKLGWESW